jgi:hypothetical protein
MTDKPAAAAKPEKQKTCFVIMPISTHDRLAADYYNNDKNHFKTIFCKFIKPALEKLDYEVIPPDVEGTQHIKGEIIKNLYNADLVLCDMSGLNPNVFFEFGIRTSFNKPVCCIADSKTINEIPFDVGDLKCHEYNPRPDWDRDEELTKLEAHIKATVKNNPKENQLWKMLSIGAVATQPAEMASVGKKDEMNYFVGEIKKLILQSHKVSVLPPYVEKLMKEANYNLEHTTGSFDTLGFWAALAELSPKVLAIINNAISSVFNDTRIKGINVAAVGMTEEDSIEIMKVLSLLGMFVKPYVLVGRLQVEPSKRTRGIFSEHHDFFTNYVRDAK